MSAPAAGRRFPVFLPVRVVRPALLLILLLLVIKTAWVSDDAFITLRTVDNWLHGHGLVWNVGERVQSFTHPLWLLVLTPVHAMVRDPYVTLVLPGMVLSLAASALLLWRLARSVTTAVLAATALSLSKFFMDYATSGLANSLLYLLAAWFVLLWFRLRDEGSGERRIFLLVLAATLMALTRLDTVLLVGPPLAVALWREGRACWRQALPGVLPLVLWEIFAVVYYGFPVPNTAYAKLNTGLPTGEVLQQGGYYFLDLLRGDPLLAVVLAAALVLTVFRAGRGTWAFGLGIGLALLYILRIGGDFMAGRFFTVPFFMAVCLLARRPDPSRRAVLGVAAVLLAAVFVPRNPVTASVDYTMPPDFHGIADERGYYHRWTGLLPRLADDHREYEWAEQGREFRRITEERGPAFQALESVGMCAYFAGPDLYVVDRFALSNAFLARLPANRTWFRGGWRIGHFYRDFPEGYLESVGQDRNLLQDKKLSLLYDDVRLATTGPLFGAGRWGALWRLNTRPGPVR